MAIRSGLSNQVMFKNETTFGTSVTPTKTIPVTSAEFDYVPNYAQGAGLFAGDLGPRAAQNVLTTVAGTGTIQMDVQNHDMGWLFACLMGTTVTPVQQAATTAWLQTHTLADPFGKSLTIQNGITQQVDGVTKPYTLLGAKVTDAEFTFTPTDTVKASFTLDAQNCVESTALASASYTAGLTPFAGGGWVVKTGTVGSEASIDGVTQCTVKISRQSKTDDYRAGNAGKKSEPILNAIDSAITGTISTDFYNKALLHDLFAAGTTTSLVNEVTFGAAGAGFPFTFRITVPGIKFTDSGTPAVGGPDIINGDLPWTWVYDGTNLPKIEYIETASSAAL